jgi:hypothetical protein
MGLTGFHHVVSAPATLAAATTAAATPATSLALALKSSHQFLRFGTAWGLLMYY